MPIPFMIPLKKPSKHKGHEGSPRKSLHYYFFVYIVSFVVKGLFAVDPNLIKIVTIESISTIGQIC
jgi:hypothetical protein